MAGLRVVRGPDWKWENQDDIEGQVGTATGMRARVGWIYILWDSGHGNEYRSGADGCCDLRVLDNGPAGVFHPHVACDDCGQNNIRGLRWKCADCLDYNLCTECYGNDKHDRNHTFNRMDTPTSPMQYVGRRKGAVKLQSRGLYCGATVVRGVDWDKGNQDGGAGNTGMVTKVGYMNEGKQSKAFLVAKWNKNHLICRRGFAGKVDVKCKDTAIGWSYYRDHLPQLRDMRDFLNKTLARLSSNEPADLLAKHIQSSFSEGEPDDGFGEVMRMLAVHTKAAKPSIKNSTRHSTAPQSLSLRSFTTPPKQNKLDEGDQVNTDRDVDVRKKQDRLGGRSEELLKELVIHEGCAAEKQVQAESECYFQPGDKVKIINDLDRVRNLQRGHGGWNDNMKDMTSVVGSVLEVDHQSGDVRVDFGGMSWIANPAVLNKYTAPKDDKETPNVNILREKSSFH